MLREAAASRPAGTVASANDEATIILRAVRATKLPTLTYDDLLLFQNLVADTWPSVHVQDVNNEELVRAIHQVLEDRQLQIVPEQVRISASFLAEIPLRSPGKLFISII